jgi:hypothetical protein
VACGPSTSPNPVGGQGGGGAGGEAGQGGMGGQGGELPTGEPCLVDADCDDDIACTLDACDLVTLRCTHAPNDLACKNDLFCDGVEVCDPSLGCRFGTPVGCSDLTPCTVDKCDEVTKSCLHEPRDFDEDGDTDFHCGGGDCDDTNPSVSSLTAELCGNFADDDCDAVADEADCATGEHDTCIDALELAGPGVYELTTVGAALDYPSSCVPAPSVIAGDVVGALLLPAGPPVDVELTARTLGPEVALTVAGLCGDAASELVCSPAYFAPQGGRFAKARLRSVGTDASPLALPVYLTTGSPSPLTLEVALLPATVPPTNETCASPEPLVPGVPTEVPLVSVSSEHPSACGGLAGELVYTFELADPADVTLYAASVDGDGAPVISLRDAACGDPSSEIACNAAITAKVYRHSLPAGTYHVALGATAPTVALLTLEVAPPTIAPDGDNCASALALPQNETTLLSFASHQDDHSLGCLVGGIDAARTLELTQPSDVLAVATGSAGDLVAVSLDAPACGAPSLACAAGAGQPARAALYDAAPGTLAVVVDSLMGSPASVTALVRPAVAATLVPFADACADAIDVPPTGGLFQGNTANAVSDFPAGCDQAGGAPNGAPDQLLRLELPAPRRVVIDMAGSAYPTLLDVRKGPNCPGDEVLSGCAIGVGPQRSFVDLDLDAGIYYLQIDGFAGQSGAWFADVYVVEP